MAPQGSTMFSGSQNSAGMCFEKKPRNSSNSGGYRANRIKVECLSGIHEHFSQSEGMSHGYIKDLGYTPPVEAPGDQ